MVKPAFQKSIDKKTCDATIGFLDKLLRILHPFMPFITEEIYQQIRKPGDPESIMIAPYPEAASHNKKIIDQFGFARQAIIAIRSARQERNISMKEPIDLYIRKNNDESADTTFDSVAMKLCNIANLSYVSEKQADMISVIVNTTELYIPLSGTIDLDTEVGNLESDLKYQLGFLQSVEKKLSNAKFVSEAPANVVEMERKKQADSLARIKVIEEQLRNLKAR